MLRLLGGTMIITGCMGLGLWYRQQFVLRLKHVRLLVEILEILMSEIAYGRATLPECCRRIGERQLEPYRSSFLEIYEKMQGDEGLDFPGVFCAAMDRCLQKLPIVTEDREAFLAFAAGQSFEDGQMQLRTIERSRDLLRGTAARLEQENREKSRMAVGLGIMSGLLLVVALL